MRVDAFDFHLSPEHIAQRPVSPRDSARLLDVGRQRSEWRVTDLPQLLDPGDLLVFNDTRVIPARLVGRRGAATIEFTLTRQAGPSDWRAYARPARRLRPGDRVQFADDFSAVVAAKGAGGEVVLAFDRADEALATALETHGATPLPPYIKRDGGPDDADREDYQTLFARRPGAVAAPTAGLHFTPRLLDALGERGVEIATVTLHVGPGTFLPVRAESVDDHQMHAEWGEVGAEVAAAVDRVRARRGRVAAVGTTSLRILETAAEEGGLVMPFAGETDIFITPGYRFRVVDLLLTNFHLPRSTLFMLVCAFAGMENMFDAYEHAKASGFRFYSYGDCCLLHRERRP